MTEPLRFRFDVSCSVEHAFDTWTRRIDTWWPADHTVSGAADAVIVLEPRVGGRIFERLPDGTEHAWGQIARWDPPDRLEYRWHLRADRDDATDVVITFSPSEQGTTVAIEHRSWERLGARGPQWRERNHGGWTTLLPHYQQAISMPVDTAEEQPWQPEPEKTPGS